MADLIHSADYAFEDQRRMSAARNYFAWQARLVKPHLGRRVLEVGCGIGNFTGALLDRELVVSIDSDADAVQRLKERYRDQPNLHASVVDASDLAGLASFQCDSAVCLNVLEHVEDELEALRGMGRVLTGDGAVVLLVPAFPALMGPIDRNLGHYRRYTRAGLRRLATDAGFEVDVLHYVNAVGFFGWWVNARVFRREAQSRFQIGFFDRFVAPVVSRAEALVRPPLGQSLFAVLRKTVGLG